MQKRVQKSCFGLISFVVSICLACSFAGAQTGANSAANKKPATPAPVKIPVLSKQPLSANSEGDLLKYGEANFKAQRFEEAREALTLGLAKKKKDDPKYTPMLKQANDALADAAAAKGDAPCKALDLVACEKQIAAAKEYATTPAVTRLAATHARNLTELQDRFQSALKLSASGEFDKALAQLKDLTKYSSHLTSVNSEIDRTTKSYVAKLASDGMRAIDEKRLEDASLQFQRVLDFDKDNASAKSGLSVIQKAHQAYELEKRALAQLTAKKFDEALKLIDQANDTFPSPEFDRTKSNIIRDYIAYLITPVPELVPAANDFLTTRDVYLRLDQVRRFDPANPVVAKYLPEVSDTFGTHVFQRATDLENIVDYSRIGTAYLLKVQAQKRLPAGIVKSEDVKTVAAAFGRKRTSQLVLSIENLSTAQAASFASTVQQRARHNLEAVALQDLRVCMNDDKKCLMDDAQFEGLRPDNKSRTAILTIGVSKYDFQQDHSPTESARSKYVNGIENIPNQEYKDKEAEIEIIRRALDKPGQKKDKPTPEGWTESTYQRKENELRRIDKTIQRDKVLDYSYSKTQYTQRTTLELNVLLRDFVTRQELKSERIRSNTPELTAEEIEGVKDTDVNNLQNKRLRLPSRDEALSAAERMILDDLDKKVLDMVPVYTNRFFNEGEKGMKANQIDEAVEAYICHFAFLRGKLPEAEMERVSDVVRRETGFDLRKEGDAFIALLD